MFTCETAGGNLGWVVNGKLRDVHSEEIRNDLIISEIPTEGGSKHETLTIPARAEYNGTTVQCAVLAFGGSDQSENVTMTIQGIGFASLEIMVWVAGCVCVKINPNFLTHLSSTSCALQYTLGYRFQKITYATCRVYDALVVHCIYLF